MKTTGVFFLFLVTAIDALSPFNRACLDLMGNLEKIDENGQKFMKMLRQQVGDDSVTKLLEVVQEARDEYAEKFDYKFSEPLQESLLAVIMALAIHDVDTSELDEHADSQIMLKLLGKERIEWKNLKTSLKRCPLDNDLKLKKMVTLDMDFAEEFARHMKERFELSSFLDA